MHSGAHAKLRGEEYEPVNLIIMGWSPSCKACRELDGYEYLLYMAVRIYQCMYDMKHGMLSTLVDFYSEVAPVNEG